MLSVALGALAAFVARALAALIGLFTNLAFFGRWSTSFTSPAANHLGPWVLGVPVVDAHDPARLVGILTRSDLLAVYARGIRENVASEPTLRVGLRRPRRSRRAPAAQTSA